MDLRTGTVNARKYNFRLRVMVTEDDLNTIHRRTAEARIINTGGYICKMALNSYVLNVGLALVHELFSLQRHHSKRLNQIAIHANTNDMYQSEIAALKKDYAELWRRISDVLKQLTEVMAL